jgi:hypothetical protein
MVCRKERKAEGGVGRRIRSRTRDYPSITAAMVVQVSPMAIPIHGVCPSVPSLRLVNSVDDLRVRSERAVLLRRGMAIVSGFACVSATCRWSICCASDCICDTSSGVVCTSDKGLDGEPFCSDGLGATACGTGSAATRAAVGARQKRSVEGFIVIMNKRWAEVESTLTMRIAGTLIGVAMAQ